jgi:glycosyltransferase involved in cell wall biosynthesis
VVRYPSFELIPNFPVPKLWSRRYRELHREVAQADFDIVITRTRFFLSSLLGYFLARKRTVPWVHIEHGSEYVRLDNPLLTLVARIYDLTLGAFVLRHSHVTVSISRAVQRFVARFDPRPSPVIYRGMDFPAIDAISAVGELRARTDRSILLATAARLYKWKGIDVTLDAIRLLPEHVRRRVTFVLMGDGSDKAHFEARAKGLPVMFTGSLPRPQVIACLKQCDIYIHSSFPGGGLSTSLLEAMACGLPPVATPYEGADEIVQDGVSGILVDQATPEALTRAIERLLDDADLRRRYGEQACREVRQRFDWDETARRYLELFNKLRP